MTTVKLKTHGEVQTLELPKEFRFKGDLVKIRRVGDAVVMSPVHEPDQAETADQKPWKQFFEATGQFSPDFMEFMENYNRNGPETRFQRVNFDDSDITEDEMKNKTPAEIFHETLGKFGPDFMADGRNQSEQQERKGLEELFK